LKHSQQRLAKDLEDLGLEHHDVSGGDDKTNCNSQEHDGKDPQDREDVLKGRGLAFDGKVLTDQC